MLGLVIWPTGSGDLASAIAWLTSTPTCLSPAPISRAGSRSNQSGY